MDQVIPWSSILSLIEPHYPKAGNGTQPMPMERMLRIYFMQQWFNLSDPAMEDALYDSESMRRFAGIELIEDAVPEESTILRFRLVALPHKSERPRELCQRFTVIGIGSPLLIGHASPRLTCIPAVNHCGSLSTECHR